MISTMMFGGLRRRWVRTGLVALAFLVFPSTAAAADFAIGARAATSGAGPELIVSLSPRLHARLVGGAFSYDTTYDATGIDYDGSIELRSLLLLLDWHPADSGFRFSAGAGWNDNQLKVSAPLEQLARRELPTSPPLPVDIGRLRGSARGDELAPYVGLGWARPFGGGRFSVNFELGALYQGEPQVELSVDSALLGGLPANVRPLLDAAAAAEEQRLEEELSDYTILPVIAFGFSFRI